MAGESLPNSWQWVTLEEVAAPAVRAIVSGPFGSNIGSRFFVESGVPVIRGGNLTSDMTRFVDDGFVFITDEKADDLGNCDAYPGDLIFTAAGSLGQVGIIPYSARHSRYIISNKQLRARVDERIVDPLFAFYWFSSPRMVAYIQQRNMGSTVPLINLSVLRSLPIPLPPIAEQRAIAHILGKLDDKIDLNRRTNEILEEMARAIFKSWFVNFDPVHAKAEGRDPGLPENVVDLFPDRFEDSKLDEIPAGWSVMPIGEAVRVVGGGTPSTKEPAFWEDGTHAWATPRDLSKLQDPILLDTERKVTDAGLAKISSGLLPAGTVLLSSRAPVGYLAVAHVPVSVNQGFIAMVCEGPLTHHYVLHWAMTNIGQIEGRASGTTFQEISKKNFRPMLALVPAAPVLSAFEAHVVPLYEKMSANLEQSRILAALRDALLPQLMSGAIRVKAG